MKLSPDAVSTLLTSVFAPGMIDELARECEIVERDRDIDIRMLWLVPSLDPDPEESIEKEPAAHRPEITIGIGIRLGCRTTLGTCSAGEEGPNAVEDAHCQNVPRFST